MSKWLKLSDEKARYLFYWLSAVVGRVLPIIIVGVKYDVFTRETRWYYKAVILIAFLAFWALIKFWGDFVEFAKDMEDGMGREALLALGRVGPYILLWGAAIAAKVGSDDFLYIASTLAISQGLAIAFSAEHRRLKRKILKARGHVRVIRD